MGQTNKALEDSLLQFIHKKETNVYWRITKALTVEGISDSFKLKLYEIQYLNITEDSDITMKNPDWHSIHALVNQGIVLEHLGADSSLVLDRFRKAHAIAIEQNRKTGILWSSIRIAKHYLNIGVLNTTEEIYHYSLIDSLVNDSNLHPETRYLGYRYLGNRHLRYNDYSTAFSHYSKAFEMAKINQDVELIVKLSNSLILITETTGDTLGNSSLIEETFKLIPPTDYYHKAFYYTSLAGYDYLPKKQEFYYLQKALHNYNMSNNKTHIVTLYMLLSDYYYDLKNADSTFHYNSKIQSTLKTLPPTQLYYDEIFVKVYEGKYLVLINDYRGAMTKLNEALKMAQDRKAYIAIPGIMENKYLFAEQSGDFENAYVYLTQYNSIKDSLNSAERQTQYQNLFVKFETEEKQKTIQVLQKEQVLSEEVVLAQKSKNKVLTLSLLVLFIMLGVVFYVLILNRKKSSSLSKLNNLKDKIFSVLSHDLRTPLVTFNSLIEIDKMKPMSADEYGKYLNMIQSELGNTRMLMESLLKWAQSNLNTLQINKSELPLAFLVESVVEIVGHYSKRETVSVKLDLEDGLLVNTDEDLLRFILRNLLFNAIKFSPENSVVSVKTERKGGEIFIYIKDNGVGLTPEQITAYQLGKMEASIDAVGDKSTGMGLSLCNEFANKLNIDISIKSEPKQGTTFILGI